MMSWKTPTTKIAQREHVTLCRKLLRLARTDADWSLVDEVLSGLAALQREPRRRRAKPDGAAAQADKT